MDVDMMSGSTLEAMATGVEDAAAVIVCLSPGYQESQACRTEALYAVRLNKMVVPVRMTPSFSPNGWLGALAAGKAVYELGSLRRAPDVAGVLAREIGDVAVASEKERFLHG